MALTFRAKVDGIDRLRRDIAAVRLELLDEVDEIVNDAARETVLPVTKQRTPIGPGPTPDFSARSDNELPHIRDTISAVAAPGAIALIVSDHPGAPVHEYGGEIAPSGHPFRIKESAMAGGAAEQTLDEMERQLAGGVDSLLTRHGL